MALIYVKDLARMAAFYEQTLGLTAIAESRTDTWLELDAGAIRLGLHAIPAHIAEGIEIANPPEAREETPLKLIFAVDDWEGLCARLDLDGRQVIRKPWGAADCLDPEGNVLEIRPGR